MAINPNACFKYCGLTEKKTPKGIKYRILVHKKVIEKKTILTLGYDKIEALNATKEVDEYITKQLINENPIDIDELKDICQKHLEKNKPQVRVVTRHDLISLWDNYVRYHQDVLKSWSETYILTHIQTVTSLIHQCPIQDIKKMDKIFEWFLSDPKRSIATSKDRLKLVVSCVEWCSKTKVIERKYGLEFRDMLSQIKLPKVSEEDEKPKVFTEQEVRVILNAFKTGITGKYPEKIKQYYPFVKFWMLTGCRPSEAIALKWENVDLKLNRIKFCEVDVMASGKRVTANRTKTEKYRYFPIGEDLHAFLSTLKKAVMANEKRLLKEGIKSESTHVFKRLDGSTIHYRTFLGVWEKLIKDLGIEYRRAYMNRHTFISHHINEGEDALVIASICGNSFDTIKSHYFTQDVSKVNLGKRDIE